MDLALSVVRLAYEWSAFPTARMWGSVLFKMNEKQRILFTWCHGTYVIESGKGTHGIFGMLVGSDVGFKVG